MTERMGGRNVISSARFADDIVIVTNNKHLISIIMSSLTTFLMVRGLSLSETKTNTFP
jgi:ribosome-interacting GTPase 1